MCFKKAIEAWCAVVGMENVHHLEKDMEDYNTTTFHTAIIARGVIFVRSASEVKQCLQIATQYKIPLYPVSKGKNYGLGSKVPVTERCMILDLQQMDKIVDFSAELCYVTLEPGVSFKNLYDYLKGTHSNLMMDSIGSTGEASIIGNTLERGHGMGLQADRYMHVCGMEVVLPNGNIVNTGFESFPNAKVGKLAKWGLGPSIEGLFTQSNLGVITKMTFWLKPSPNFFQTFLFYIEDDKSLVDAIGEARTLKLSGLQFSLRIFNDYRMVSFFSQYPWKRMGGKTPLSQAELDKLKKRHSIQGKWVGIGALYSLNRAIGKEEGRLITKAFDPYVNTITIYNAFSIKKQYKQANARERDFLNLIYFKSPLLGIPSESPMHMCYWRKKTSIPSKNIDIHRDQCGVLWYCPAIPFTGKDVLAVVSCIEVISKKYKFEPNLGFLFINERTIDITGAICYDKAIKAEDIRAKACHDEILRGMSALGYFPYRLGIQSMSQMNEMNNNNLELLQDIKKVFDPHNTLAPGRYIPMK